MHMGYYATETYILNSAGMLIFFMFMYKATTPFAIETSYF